MKDTFTILIADRNPHVRDFLKRELVAEGYEVRLARNVRETLGSIYDTEPLDLLILDLDLPDANELNILEKLQDRMPSLPVIVHTYMTDYKGRSLSLNSATFVEKEGSNIDGLKRVVRETLMRSYPK
jgi:DNA-binding NtrC family response regulator